MYPEQQPAPYQGPQPGQAPPSGDPYRFIMEPPKAPKTSSKGSLPGISGNSFIKKILLIVGGAVVLMFVIGILVNVIFGSKTNTDSLLTLAQTETEIIRIAGQSTSAGDQRIKNAAITTQLSLTTHQQEWITYLARSGRKITAKDLGLKKDNSIDTQLTQAKQTSTFDPAFIRVMRSQLEAYRTALQEAQGSANGKQARSMIATDLNDTALLLNQWPIN